LRAVYKRKENQEQDATRLAPQYHETSYSKSAWGLELDHSGSLPEGDMGDDLYANVGDEAIVK